MPLSHLQYLYLSHIYLSYLYTSHLYHINNLLTFTSNPHFISLSQPCLFNGWFIQIRATQDLNTEFGLLGILKAIIYMHLIFTLTPWKMYIPGSQAGKLGLREPKKPPQVLIASRARAKIWIEVWQSPKTPFYSFPFRLPGFFLCCREARGLLFRSEGLGSGWLANRSKLCHQIFHFCLHL